MGYLLCGGDTVHPATLDTLLGCEMNHVQWDKFASRSDVELPPQIEGAFYADMIGALYPKSRKAVLVALRIAEQAYVNTVIFEGGDPEQIPVSKATLERVFRNISEEEPWGETTVVLYDNGSLVVW